MSTEHHWRIKKQCFNLLLSGQKRLEVRVGYPEIKKAKAGDRIVFDHHGKTRFLIKRVAIYCSFREMLQAEVAEDIVPNLTATQVLSVLRQIYSTEKERLGVYAFELRPTTRKARITD